MASKQWDVFNTDGELVEGGFPTREAAAEAADEWNCNEELSSPVRYHVKPRGNG
jgi:hypothetical protein